MHLVTEKSVTPQVIEESTAVIFDRQQQCLTLIKLLAQLTKAVQRHRGASMSVLSGERGFLSIADTMSKRIETILSVLDQCRFDDVFDGAKELTKNIIERWSLIADDWAQDQLLHNFEFHSHLVDALIGFIRQAIREDFVGKGNEQQQAVFLVFDSALIQLLDTAEMLAILRGLSTNAAVLKTCGPESRSRIGYLLKELPRHHRALLYTLNRLKEDGIKKDIGANIADQQKQMQKFLLSIEITILDNHDISSDSSRLFALSTEFVDLHWDCFEQLVQQLEKRMYEQLLGVNPLPES